MEEVNENNNMFITPITVICWEEIIYLRDASFWFPSYLYADVESVILMNLTIMGADTQRISGPVINPNDYYLQISEVCMAFVHTHKI